jgi:hypothetical protein
MADSNDFFAPFGLDHSPLVRSTLYPNPCLDVLINCDAHNLDDNGSGAFSVEAPRIVISDENLLSCP